MDRPIGRLERVEPATVWSSEPGDFVPWLAAPENLRDLGEVLRLDLEAVAREIRVGRFRADLLCRDRGTGATVVIEAQLGSSDHGHLGQLLTYAVGLQARAVVWLAARVYDEHRAVLDRLNQSGAALGCFAVEMALWKIGASTAAPRFTVVARPRDWPLSVIEAPGVQAAAAGEADSPADAADPRPVDETAISTIRMYRKRLGMTQKQLAEAAGISAIYLSQIETGRRSGPPETRAALAKALALHSCDPT